MTNNPVKSFFRTFQGDVGGFQQWIQSLSPDGREIVNNTITYIHDGVQGQAVYAKSKLYMTTQGAAGLQGSQGFSFVCVVTRMRFTQSTLESDLRVGGSLEWFDPSMDGSNSRISWATGIGVLRKNDLFLVLARATDTGREYLSVWRADRDCNQGENIFGVCIYTTRVDQGAQGTQGTQGLQGSSGVAITCRWRKLSSRAGRGRISTASP